MALLRSNAAEPSALLATEVYTHQTHTHSTGKDTERARKKTHFDNLFFANTHLEVNDGVEFGVVLVQGALQRAHAAFERRQPRLYLQATTPPNKEGVRR